jgi:hypothetical protein
MHEKFGLQKETFAFLKKLNTPQKIQNYLDTLPINYEEDGETYMSVERSLRVGKVHCLEAALIAACAIWIQGGKPLLVDFKTHKDEDHVVALFKVNNHWGAISKTNHAVLRYRDPIYRTLRELALSYFHEYTNTKGVKSLRSFSVPFTLLRYKNFDWVNGEKDLHYIAEDIDDIEHTPIITAGMAKLLRNTDTFERSVINNNLEWPRPTKASQHSQSILNPGQ